MPEYSPVDFQVRLQTTYRPIFNERVARLEAPAALLARQYGFQLFLSQPGSLPISLLVCGLKPYAKTGGVYRETLPNLPPKYHAYLDEKWTTPYVPRVLHLIRHVQSCLLRVPVDPRQTLVTNWYFQRAEDARQLKIFGCELPDTLPYHQRIITHYQPQVILCVGNGKVNSAFAGMSMLFKVPETAWKTQNWQQRSQLKCFRTDKRLVVGVPHLSRYSPDTELLQWLENLSSQMQS